MLGPTAETSSVSLAGAAVTRRRMPAVANPVVLEPFDKFGDASETRRFLQAACEKFVQDFLGMLSRLQPQTPEINSMAALPYIEQFLFLGRLCKAVAELVRPLEQLVLLPGAAALEATLSRLPRRSNRRHRQLSEHEKRLAEIKNNLTARCTESFGQWASWAAATRASIFSGTIATQDWRNIAPAKRVCLWVLL